MPSTLTAHELDALDSLIGTVEGCASSRLKARCLARFNVYDGRFDIWCGFYEDGRGTLLRCDVPHITIYDGKQRAYERTPELFIGDLSEARAWLQTAKGNEQ